MNLAGRPLRRAVVLSLGILAFPGCYSWRVRSMEDQVLVKQPETLRLLLSSGERIVIADAIARDDSVVGQAEKDDTRVAVRRQQVLDVHARKLDVPITAALALGGIVGSIVTIGVLTAGTCGAGPTPSC